MKFLERTKSSQGRNPIPDRKKQEDLGTGHARHDDPATVDVAGRPSMQRPRTSNVAVERIRDLRVPGGTIEITSDDAVFRFPTPSPRLPPDEAFTPSPRLPHSATFPPRSPSSIGIALGSPSHLRVHNWKRSLTTNDVSLRSMRQEIPGHESPSRMGPLSLPIEVIDQPPASRKQKSAWKTFGGLFQKRTPKQNMQEPFYKVQHPELILIANDQPSPALATPVSEVVETPISMASHDSRTRSLPRSLARHKYKARLDRTHSEKTMPLIRGTLSIDDATRLSRTSADMFRSNPTSRSGSPVSSVDSMAIPRLNVNIPNVEMERYSVMFEKLLKQPAPSLLERRNGTLKKLRAVKITEEGTDQENVETLPVTSDLLKIPTGRAQAEAKVTNSITRSRSPSLSLFPPPNIQRANTTTDQPPPAIHRPRPLRRYNTAPSDAVSPAKARFVHSATNLPASLGSTSPTWSEGSLPSTPTSSDCQTFVSCDDNGEVSYVSHDPLPLVPRLGEPSWDMLTSKPANLIDDHKHTHDRSLDETDQHIVQVSVARQVSVSRARARIKKPLNSKQPLRPRVVELKNRKSTVVLIENA